jgi:WD40 repeat protein
MNNNLIKTNNNAKLALSKSKSLLSTLEVALSKKTNSNLTDNFQLKPYFSDGHTSSIHAVAITPDARNIISGSWDETIKIWDIKSGKCIKTLYGHTGSVNSIVITSDGKTIISGSNDKTIRLWDIKSGKCINILEGHTSYVFSLIITPNREIIISGSSDLSIKLWDIKSGECIKTLKDYSGVYSLAITPDGKTIISGYDNGSIKLWDIKSGECIKTLKGYNEEYTPLTKINSLVVSPDGKTIISGSHDKTIRLWDIKSGECINTLKTNIPKGYSSYIYSVAVTPDGGNIVSGSNDKTIKLWDIKNGKCIKTLEGHTSQIFSVVVTPNGKTIISGGQDKIIKLWDIKSGECITTFECHTEKVSKLKDDEYTYTIKDGSMVTILKNGFFTASKENIDKFIRINDTPLSSRKLTKEEIEYFSEVDDKVNKEFHFKPYIEKFSNNTVNFVVTPNCKNLITSDLNTIKLWDIKTGKYLKTIKNYSNGSGRVIYMKINLGGDKLALGTSIGSWNDEYNEIQLWDIQTSKSLKEEEIDSGTLIKSLIINARGDKIIYGDNHDDIKLWDICLDNFEYFRGHESSVISLVMTPDEEILASGSYCEIKIWDMITTQCLNTFKGHDSWIYTLAITSDGKKLISGSDDNSIKIWNIRSGLCIKTLIGHNCAVKTLLVTPNGKNIISGSDDKTIKIWDIQTGQCLKTIENYAANGLSVTPDGKYIILNSIGNDIEIWNIQTYKCIYSINHTYEIAINENGYFNASKEAIEKNLRIKEDFSTKRKLTETEIKYFYRENLMDIEDRKETSKHCDEIPF